MRPLAVKKSESVAREGKALNGVRIAAAVSTGLKAGVNENFLSCSACLQPLQGEAGDFARVFQVEFIFDVRPVCFHRFGAQMQ